MNRNVRNILLCVGCCLVGVFLPTATLGQEKSERVEVFRKSTPKTQKRFIVKETNTQVEFSKGYTIPASDIADIDYRDYFPLSDQSRQIYDAARKAEKAASKAQNLKERHQHLADAISKYQAALKKLAANPKALVLKKAPRHCKFKIAYIKGILGLEQSNRTKQVEATYDLEKFKKEHGKDIWQYVSLAEMLIKLHTARDEFAKAEAVVDELGRQNISKKVANNAQIFLLERMMKKGKHADALPKLTRLVSALPNNSDVRMRARLAEAQCTAATKQLATAVEKVKAILNETKDNKFRGRAYNTLGLCYYESKDYQKAVWQFLWVDVIYNHDKEEHAKAVYYLWQSFKKLGELDRAQRFYNSLRTDTQFVGTLYRRLAESN